MKPEIKRHKIELILSGASGVVYQYSDDPTRAYINNLKVEKKRRGRGLGNILLLACENFISDNMADVEYIYLKVAIGSWHYDWYLRKGYEVMLSERRSGGQIWVRKTINI